MGKFSIKVIGGGVFIKNKPQTITITWEIKDEDGNKVIPDKLWINNIIQDPATTSKTYNRVYSDVDFTVKAIKDDIVAIGITTARFLGPNQTVEDSLNSSSNSIALSANQGKVLNEKIDNASNKFKGLFTTLIDLKKKIRTGEEGDWAIVGESIPANIFRWGDEGWESTGGTYDGTVDLTPYTRETKTIEYTDDYNVSKNHTHVIKVYDVINWATVTYDPTAPVYKFGDSYDEGEVVNMIDDIAFSYKALSSTATAPYLTQESNAYTLEDAITLLPEELATAGQKISFYNIKEESWMTYVFTGGDHKNATFWEVFTNNVDKDINNLQNQITESNNKFNSIDNKFTEVDKEIDNLDDKIDNLDDKIDNVDSHILLSSTSIACGGEDIELVADRAYKDSDGNIITDTYVTREGLTNSIIDITNQQVTDLKPGSVDPEDLSEATKQLLGNKFIVNLPDEEDITTKNQSLKLKDKEYSPKDYSGMGRKRLRKHYVNGVNVLTQHMINKPNTIYIIEYDYCLADQTIEIPSNCILQFEGGSLRNGYIKGSNTIIEGKLEGIFYPTIDFIGDWNVPFISSSMFNNKNEINLLKKLLKLSNDNVQNIIEITKGEYPVQHNNYVTTEKIIELTSNTKLILEGNILLLPSSYISYQIIHIRDKVNVEIIGGGSIIGDKHTHLGTEGEWGHGIAIYNSNNVTIRDIKIEKCFGDCIYIGIGNKNINVERCTLNEGRRQGISVISGEMIVIDGCRISNVYGTEPEAAIDIEPNENDVIDNVIIRNCICENCTKGIIAQKLDRYINAKINKVYIDNCIVESNNICIMAYNASTVTLSNSNIKSKYIYTVNIERANYCKINNNYIEQIYSYDNGRCVLFGSANDNFFIEDNVFITPYSFIRPSDNNYIKGNFIKCNNFNFTDQGIYNFLFINNVFEGSINFLGLIEGVISNNIMKLTSSFNLRGLYNQCIKNIISNNKITYVGDEEIDGLIFIRTEQNQISNNTFFIPDNKVKAVFKSSNYGNYYYNNKLFGIPIENMYDIILEKNIVIDNNVKTVDNFKIPSYLSNIYNGGLFYNTIERSAKYFVDSKFYNFNGSYSGDYHFLTTSNVQSIINNNQSETYFVNQTIDLKGAELNISEGSTIIYFSGSFMNGAIKGDNIRLIGAYILEDICNDVTVDVTYSNGNIIYDNSYKRNFIYVDREKRNFDGSNITDVGLSSQRPTGKGVSKGFQFYDLNLNKPIWWTGTNWVDATGTTV